MEYSGMKLPAPATGHAGMELPLNNFVLEVFSTMKMLTVAIGLR
jgi:hypothetical protein